MDSPTSNLGRGFDTLLRDIERWKGRTSDASVGPGTIHGRYFYYGDYDKASPRAIKVHTLILRASATITTRCKTCQVRLLACGCSDITGRGEIIMVSCQQCGIALHVAFQWLIITLVVYRIRLRPTS